MKIQIGIFKKLFSSSSGEVENYMNRVFLLYDGIHYDPMGYEDSSNPGVALQTAFPVTDDGVVLEALAIAEDAKKVSHLMISSLLINDKCKGVNIDGQGGVYRRYLL